MYRKNTFKHKTHAYYIYVQKNDNGVHCQYLNLGVYSRKVR